MGRFLGRRAAHALGPFSPFSNAEGSQYSRYAPQYWAAPGALCRSNHKPIDDVIVSLDGPPAIHDEIRRVPGAFSQLAVGVRSLRRCDSIYPISARCTVQRCNFSSLREAANQARTLGLNSISFLAADLTSERLIEPSHGTQIANLRSLFPKEKFRYSNASWMAFMRTGKVPASSWKARISCAGLRGISKLSRAAQAESPRCNAPWTSAVVEADGTVRPCFFHRSIGSLKSHTLMQILNGFEAQQFRAALNIETNAVCKKCVCSLNWKLSANGG